MCAKNRRAQVVLPGVKVLVKSTTVLQWCVASAAMSGSSMLAKEVRMSMVLVLEGLECVQSRLMCVPASQKASRVRRDWRVRMPSKKDSGVMSNLGWIGLRVLRSVW